MKSSRPKTDPQPEDVLQFKGWTITVIARWPAEVEYSAMKPGERAKSGRQPLSVWIGWARGAKVKSTALSAQECTPTANVSAHCEVEKHPISGMSHCVDLKIYCSEHCPATHRPKKGLLHARVG